MTPIPAPAEGRFGQLVRRIGTRREQPPLERCELCGEAVAPRHRHLVDIPAGELLCACQACTILFDREAAAEGRLRLVPSRRLPVNLELDDAQLQAIGIPVGLVFFVCSTSQSGVVARFPSPAGPTETMVDGSDWAGVVAAAPALAGLQPDVEAFLVNRVRGARKHWIVPVDDCYGLIGLFRTSWRGMTGGDELWAGIRTYFEQLPATNTEVAHG